MAPQYLGNHIEPPSPAAHQSRVCQGPGHEKEAALHVGGEPVENGCGKPGIFSMNRMLLNIFRSLHELRLDVADVAGVA